MNTSELGEADGLALFVESVVSRMFFSRPGIINAFYPDTQRADVVVGIKAKKPVKDGRAEYEELPLIVNAPIAIQHSPSAGLAVTFPIRPGDPCTLLFSDRMMDLFLERGEMSLPEANGLDNLTTEPRQHEIEDAVCLPGVIVKSNALADWNNDAVEIRDRERNTFASVQSGSITATDGEATATMAGGRVTVNAPNGAELTDGVASLSVGNGRIAMTAPNGLTIDAPNMRLDGSAGFLGGVWTASDFRTDGGFSAETHRHGGVESGGSNTGTFV